MLQKIDASVVILMEGREGEAPGTVEFRLRVNTDKAHWTDWTPVQEKMKICIPGTYDVEVVLN